MLPRPWGRRRSKGQDSITAPERLLCIDRADLIRLGGCRGVSLARPLSGLLPKPASKNSGRLEHTWGLEAASNEHRQSVQTEAMFGCGRFFEPQTILPQKWGRVKRSSCGKADADLFRIFRRSPAPVLDVAPALQDAPEKSLSIRPKSAIKPRRIRFFSLRPCGNDFPAQPGTHPEKASGGRKVREVQRGSRDREPNDSAVPGSRIVRPAGQASGTA